MKEEQKTSMTDPMFKPKLALLVDFEGLGHSSSWTLGLEAELVKLGMPVSIDVCASEMAVRAALCRMKVEMQRGAVCAYALVTSKPERYTKLALSNNVIRSCAGLQAADAAKRIQHAFSAFGKEKQLQDDVWFIADPHFSHANIIKYCNRPFADVDEMDRELVMRWNAAVRPDDVVWCLGDFAFGGGSNVQKFISQLNGKVRLVMGNHDHKKVQFYYEAGFDRVYDHPVLLSSILLSHAPCTSVQNVLNLYGHVHDSVQFDTVTDRSICCCVERWGYAPVSWKELKSALQQHLAAEDAKKT